MTLASQSFLPRLVPRRALPSANARLDQSRAVVQASGPALAGVLVKLLAAPFAVLLDAASYFVSAILLLVTPVAEPSAAGGSMRQIPRQALDGLRWVYRHPMLRPLALDTNGWFICNAAAGAVVAPYAIRSLGFNALAFGLTMAAAGAGSLIGALSAMPLGRRFRPGWTIIAGRTAHAIGWAVVAIAPFNDMAGWLVFGVVRGRAYRRAAR